MRVLVVSESFLPTVNGVTNSVCKVLDHLALRGHEARVMVPACGAPATYAGFPVEQIASVAYRQFPVGLPSLNVQRTIENFDPDVIHVAAPFLLGAEAIAAGRRLGIPTVAIFQTDIAGYTRRNRLAALESVAWRVMRRIHRDATVTLVPSSSTMTALRDAGFRRLKRWGRGVDLVAYHPRNRQLPATRELRRQFGTKNEVVVGYVGRIAPEKQVERMSAVRGIPGIHLVIVGNGPSLPLLRRELAGMPVTFLGELQGKALAAAYASFDIFLHTGEHETFGQTIQEAQASGIPVIAPRAGGPVDLVVDGVNGFLYPPGNSAELRSTVELLARDPALRQRMGEAGRRSVLGRDWAAVCDALFDRYRRVIRTTEIKRERRSLLKSR
jgi:phosphatidylinositol alpha 1,6-mannosyltransferase